MKIPLICYSVFDTESSLFLWIPAFAGMTFLFLLALWGFICFPSLRNAPGRKT